jgi:hypothetical protein
VRGTATRLAAARRPAGFSEEQSAALKSHSLLLSIRNEVNEKPRFERQDGRRYYNNARARLCQRKKAKVREDWTVQQAVEDIERNIRGETISKANRSRSSRPMSAAQRYIAIHMASFKPVP